MNKNHLMIILFLLILALIAVLFLTSDQDLIRLAASKNPQRIITLSPNLTEIAFALGLGDRIVAVSSDSDYPPAAKEKPKVGSFWQPNLEAIVAAKPDLVITEHFEQQISVSESLSRAKIRSLVLRFDRLFQLRQAIQQIGDAAGCRKEAEKLIFDIEDKILLLQAEVKHTKEPTVLWVVQAEPLRAAGQNTFINDLLKIAGGRNAVRETFQQYPQIDEEGLLALQPDVIIQSAMGKSSLEEQQKDAIKYWSKLSALTAVKTGNIYVVDSDLVLRLGPRLPQGIEAIARTLHPEKFQPSDSEKNE
jgi:iron complex transport system substrate-binding protein